MPDNQCYSCHSLIDSSADACPHCHQPLILDSGHSKYRIVQILGQGGQGVVYEAIEVKLERRCAIKVVIAPSQDQQQQVEMEAKILAQNAPTFPFIPDVYAIWSVGGQTFLVMEYIEGQTLDELAPFAPSEVEQFLRTMLGYLVDLHNVKIFHRDIKPTNIKRTPSGRYILLDFGIAKQGEVTQSGAKARSRQFSPPEQFLGQPTDARSELFSLAATACYLLRAYLPEDVVVRHATDKSMRLHSQGDSTIPRGLQTTLLQMLEPDPKERPSDAAAALKLLDVLGTSTESITATPIHRNVLLSLFVGTSIVIALGMLIYTRSHDPTSEKPGEAMVASSTIVTSSPTISGTVTSNCGGTAKALEIPSSPADFNSQFGFTLYNTSNSYLTADGGLLGNTIRSLLVDDNGAWIGYGISQNGNRGISHVSNSLEGNKRSWEACADSKGGAIGHLVNSITKDNRGNIWAATDGDGVWKLSNGRWQQFMYDEKAPTDILPHAASYTVVAHGNTIYAGTLTGVVKYDGTKWMQATEMADQQEVHAIVFAPNGDIWVGFVKEGIRHISANGASKNYGLADGLSSLNVRSIVIDDMGRVWVATIGGGINVFDNGRWSAYRASSGGLLSDNVNVLAKDRFGRIWAGTDKGTSYFDGKNWNLYSNLDTWAIGFGKSMRERCSLEDDYVWIGTNGSGLTEARLPARTPVISSYKVTGLPTQLSPSTIVSPSVTINIEDGYTLAPGDSLHIIDQPDYIKYPFIAVTSEAIKSYVFNFTKDTAIHVPKDAGQYQSVWRLWQCGRYVGPPIKIAFTVH